MIIDLITKDWEDVDTESKLFLIETYLDNFIDDLDKNLIQLAVHHIKINLSSDGECQIIEEFEKFGVVWFARFHYREFGLQARNMLRDFVCLDEELPTGNWEDYYSSLFEVALGLRKIDGVHI